jgi:hypothetical protein
MPWTTPPTFTASQVVNETDLNTYLKDNLIYLFSGRGFGTKTFASTATTTSATFVDVDVTNCIITLTIHSGRAVCAAVLPALNATAGTTATFDWIVDGTTRASGGGTSGNGTLQHTFSNSFTTPVTILGYFTGLSDASHTFKLQWRTSGGTLTTQTTGTMIVLEV